MTNIFVYGTLMFEDVWNRVVEGDYEKVDGTLHGYVRKAVKGEEYPAVIKGDPDSMVKGLICLGVDDHDLKLLDHFEGDDYVRVCEEVETTGNGIIKAEVYVLKRGCENILDDCDWDMESFADSGIQRFIKGHDSFFSK